MCETQLNCQISHLCYQYLLNSSRNLHTIKKIEQKTVCLKRTHLDYKKKNVFGQQKSLAVETFCF